MRQTSVAFWLVLCSLWLCGFGSVSGAESHHIVVLDAVQLRRSASRILLVETESGRILRQVQAGHQARMALSPKGDIVGVISLYSIGKGAGAHRAEFYGGEDLAPLQQGLLPVSPSPLQHSGGTFYFSPDGTEFVLQDVVNSELMYCLKREVDSQGVFQLSRQPVEVRYPGVQFLRTVDWPRAIVWFRSGLSVVDFSTGKISPSSSTLDIRRFAGRTSVHTLDGRYGYYVAEHRSFLRKIDLAADPPKVVVKSEQPREDLRPWTAAVSAAGTLFVVEKKRKGSSFAPSRRIHVFNTRDLTHVNEIVVSVEGVDDLAASVDGKYLYALSSKDAKAAIIDVTTGREVKILDNTGKYPIMVIALPQQSAE